MRAQRTRFAWAGAIVLSAAKEYAQRLAPAWTVHCDQGSRRALPAATVLKTNLGSHLRAYRAGQRQVGANISHNHIRIARAVARIFK